MTYEMKIQEERDEVREEGRADGITEMVKNLLNVGTPIEYICKASGWTEEQVLAVK